MVSGHNPFKLSIYRNRLPSETKTTLSLFFRYRSIIAGTREFQTSLSTSSLVCVWRETTGGWVKLGTPIVWVTSLCKTVKGTEGPR